MVRELEAGLGIPAKVLIQKSDQNLELQYQYWDTWPRLEQVEEQRILWEYVPKKKYHKVELLKHFFSESWNH